MANDYLDLVGDENTQVEVSSDDNSYLDIVSDQAEKSEFSQAQIVSQNEDPERMAEAVRLSKKHNVNPMFILDNLDDFKKPDPLNYEDLSKSHPKLSSYLSKPENATISKGDEDTLKRVEEYYDTLRPYNPDDKNYFRVLKEAGQSGFEDLGSSAMYLGLAYGLTNDDSVYEAIANLSKRKQEYLDQKPEYIKEFNQKLEEESKDISEEWKNFKSSFSTLREGKILDGLSKLGSGALTVAETADWILSAGVRPKALFATSVESLAFSAPSLATGFAGLKTGGAVGGALGSVIPGAGTAAGALVGGVAGGLSGMFAGSVGTEIGAWISQALNEKGVDTTDPLAIKKAFQDKKFIAKVIGEAERKGVTTAAVDTLFTAIGGKFIKSGVGQGFRKTVVQGAKGVGVETVGESASEAAGQLAAYEGNFSKLSINDILLEGVASLGTSAATTAGVQTVTKTKEAATTVKEEGAKGAVEKAVGFIREKYSKNPVQAAEEITLDAVNAQQSLLEAKALEATMNEVAKSETKKRSPEKIKELLGEDEKFVYFQKDDLDKHFTEKGEAPVEKMKELLSLDSYKDAEKTGDLVKVPASEFVEKYAGTEDQNVLLNIVQTNPEAMKAEEAVKAIQDLKEGYTQLAEEAKQVEQKKNVLREGEKEVREQLKASLDEAGINYTTQDLKPILAFYKTIAQRSGGQISPKVFADRFKLEFRKGETAEEGAFKKVFNQVKKFFGKEEVKEQGRDFDYDPESGDFKFKNTEANVSLRTDSMLEDLAEGLGDELEEALEINTLEVSPDVQGQGQGSEAIKRIEQIARDEGQEFIVLKAEPLSSQMVGEADSANLERLKSFYERNGFEVFKENETNFIMFKKVEIQDQQETKDQTKTEEFAQEEKGRILFNNDKKFIIEMFKTADKSTLHHESAHYFLEVVKSLGTGNNAIKDYQEMFETIKEHLGSKDGEFTVEQHELFARSYEQYLREGQAPSKGLKEAFRQFKQWLIQIYRDALDLNAPINDDIRNVFDRLLATDEEIAEVKGATGDSKPLLEDPIAQGMPQSMAEKYDEAIREADQYAQEELFKKHYERIEKEDSKDFKKALKEEKQKVLDKLNEQTRYKALAHLRYGKDTQGNELDSNTPRFKLDLEYLKKNYDQKVLDKLPKSTYRIQGDDPEIIASFFGYEDAETLIMDMANAPEKEQHAEDIALQTLRENDQDLLTTDEITDLALEAVNNESKETRLKLEYEFLKEKRKTLTRDVTKRLIQEPSTSAQIKEEAKIHIDKMPIKDVTPNRFRVLERQYAKKTAEAWGKRDIEAAFDFQRRRLMANYMFKFALENKDSVRKNQDFIKKIFKSDKDLAKTRDINYVNAARAVLSRYGLGPGKEVPLNYIKDSLKYDPETAENISFIIESLIEDPKHHSDLTLSEYNDLMDGVKTLWGLSREVKQIEINGKKIEIEEAAQEIIEQFEKTDKRKSINKDFSETSTKREKTIKGLLSLEANLSRFEFVVDYLDLGDFNGPFRKYIYQPIQDAYTKYQERLTEESKRINDLLKEKRKEIDLEKEIKAPEFGFKFKNKSELLAALLHIGNESNYKKLLLGYEWATVDEEGNLNDSNWKSFIKRMWDEGTLTKSDYEFVKDLTKIMSDIKPDAQKAHKRIMGFYFDEIKTWTVTLPDGSTMEGWYAPAALDKYANVDIARRADFEESMQTSYMNPSPHSGGGGAFKKRNEQFAGKLDLSLGVVSSHVRDVLRYTYMKPAVVDAHKVLKNRSVTNTLDERNPSLISNVFEPALNRADKDQLYEPDKFFSGFLGNMMQNLKSLASAQIFFGNIKNTIEQTFDIPSAVALMPKEVNTKTVLKNMMKSPKAMMERVNEINSDMKKRNYNELYEVQKQTREIFEEDSLRKDVKEWGMKNAFIMQSSYQNVIENAVFISNFDYLIRQGVDPETASKKSYSIVKRAFGSKQPFDVSNMETSKMLGFFQMFMGWFNVKYNSNKTAFMKLMVEDVGFTEKTKAFAYLYWMNFAVIAVMSEALSKALGGTLDEDGDDEYLDDVIDILFMSQIRMATAMIPVSGPMIQGIFNRTDENKFNDRLSGSPAAQFFVDAASTIPAYLSGNIPKDEGRVARDVLMTTGYATGLPLAPLAKPIKYMNDVENGKVEVNGPIDYVRGLVTGKGPKK